MARRTLDAVSRYRTATAGMVLAVLVVIDTRHVTRCPQGSIQISNLISTPRYCEQPECIMEQEARFYNGLLSAERYAIEDDELTLSWGMHAIVFDLAKA
jgi:META domain